MKHQNSYAGSPHVCSQPGNSAQLILPTLRSTEFQKGEGNKKYLLTQILKAHQYIHLRESDAINF